MVRWGAKLGRASSAIDVPADEEEKGKGRLRRQVPHANQGCLAGSVTSGVMSAMRPELIFYPATLEGGIPVPAALPTVPAALPAVPIRVAHQLPKQIQPSKTRAHQTERKLRKARGSLCKPPKYRGCRTFSTPGASTVQVVDFVQNCLRM